jgi:UDP-2-acetamido-3-amino-2,3-dideoxy-glucuronate N-acetyltransferase
VGAGPWACVPYLNQRVGEVEAIGGRRKDEAMKIGLIGAGAWGQNHLRVWKRLGALAVVCEADDTRRSRLQGEYPDLHFTPSLRDLTGDPAIQGIVIATPAETHFRLGKECLLAGKDVFIEKPLLKLKAMVQGGELGKINYVYSNRLNFGRIRTEENILWSFAPHDISVMLMLLNEMPVRVASQGGNYLHLSIADVTVSNFQFASGANAHIFVSWLHPFKEQKLVVVGESQMAVFDDMVSSNKLMLYPHRIQWVNRMPVPEKAEGVPVEFEKKEPLEEECRHFLECIETRKAPRTDGEEGLRVLRLLNACQGSLEQQGRQIDPGASVAAPRLGYSTHPTSCVDEPCEIGQGTKIWHYSHIMRDCKIGRNCNIGQNVVVSPGCVLGENVKVQNNVSIYTGVVCEDDVFLGPSMVFTNVINPRSHIVRRNEYRQTLVKKGASIGANATIVCGHTIGRYAFVGAGAVVTKDVQDYALVVGNPARRSGWMCQCGNRLSFSEGASQAACSACHSRYQKVEGQLQPVELAV